LINKKLVTVINLRSSECRVGMYTSNDLGGGTSKYYQTIIKTFGTYSHIVRHII
jgi:hypothetical protein